MPSGHGPQRPRRLGMAGSGRVSCGRPVGRSQSVPRPVQQSGHVLRGQQQGLGDPAITVPGIGQIQHAVLGQRQARRHRWCGSSTDARRSQRTAYPTGQEQAATGLGQVQRLRQGVAGLADLARTREGRPQLVPGPAQLQAAGIVITFEAVAREAGVSRSWLYNQPDLRAETERLRARHRPVPAARPVPDRQRASEASLLRRLEAAIERNRQLEAENRELRQALALALGEQRTADVRGVRVTAKPPVPRAIGPC